jgi:uncharacterized membrane-anchored protein
LAVQVRAKRFHPLPFGMVIVATTTVGITLAPSRTRAGPGGLSARFTIHEC